MFALRRLGLLILICFAASISGCAAGRSNLTDTGAVNVQVEETPKVRIRGVTVLADQEETVVYGRIRRLGVYDNPFAGNQVIASAVLPDGSTYVASDRILLRTPRARSFRTIYPVASFKIEFPGRLPTGTIVYLKFTSRDLA